MADYQRYELFEDYLTGNLTKNDRLSLEKELQDNPELKEEFDLHSLSHDLVEMRGEDLLEAEIRERFIEKKRKSTFVKRFLLLGGVVGLFLTGTAIYFTTISNEEVLDVVKEEPHSSPQELIYEPQKEEGPQTELEKYEVKTEAPIVSVSQKNVISANENILKKDTVRNKEVLPEPSPKITKTEKPKVKEEKSVTAPCQGIVVGFTSKITSSCEGQNNGRISVQPFGGERPYAFELDGMSYTAGDQIEDLSSGEYELGVVDNNGCVSELKSVSVREKMCFKPQKAFNPSEQNWGYKEELSVTLIIKDQLGKEVFKENGTEFSWDGTNKNGEELSSNQYFYFVLRDGDVIDQGFVTIVR